MKAGETRITQTFLVLTAAISLAPLASVAATLTVDCGAGEKIQEKVAVAKPGDTIQVSGTCIDRLTQP